MPDDSEDDDNDNDGKYEEDDVYIEDDRNEIPEAPSITFVSEEDLRIVVAKVRIQKAKRRKPRIIRKIRKIRKM